MIQPLADRILVRPYTKPDETEGGILIPDSAKADESGTLWEVVALGPGRVTRKGVRVPIDGLLEGDIIETHRWTVAEMPPVDGIDETLYIVGENDVLGVVWRSTDG